MFTTCIYFAENTADACRRNAWNGDCTLKTIGLPGKIQNQCDENSADKRPSPASATPRTEQRKAQCGMTPIINSLPGEMTDCTATLDTQDDALVHPIIPRRQVFTFALAVESAVLPPSRLWVLATASNCSHEHYHSPAKRLDNVGVHALASLAQQSFAASAPISRSNRPDHVATKPANSS